MNVNCSICSDIFNSSDEIFATRCGHAFHQTCLLQWMERSKTCPQCRAKTTDKSIFKIYFNILSSEGIKLDAVSLQAKLDTVEFQFKQNEKQLSKQNEEIMSLQKLCCKSEESLMNAKEKLKTKDVAINGLKEQVDYLKADCKEISKLREDKEKLQKDLNLLKGLEEIIYGTTSEVAEMVKCQTDMHALCIYIMALKRATADMHSKKKRLAESLRSFQNQLSCANTEKMDQQTKIVTLEDSLSHAESEIKQLKRTIGDLESQQSKSAITKNVMLLEDEDNSPNENSKRKWNTSGKSSSCSPKKSPKLESEGRILDVSVSINSPQSCSKKKHYVKSIIDSDSPYLNLKRSNPLAAFQLKKSSTSLKVSSEFSIFKTNKLSKKLKLDNNRDLFKAMQQSRNEQETTYNGLGGHSKMDVFPVGKNHFTVQTLTKKSISKEKMKGLKRPANQATLENIFHKK